MREAPKVVTRDAIEQELWGDDLPDSDTLRSHLYNLRQVVDKPFDSPLIETLPGRGYRIRTPEA
jgi:DNA-binding winged helix-turn-helix (wHTH) protein